MNDHTESELRAALQERGDRISPTPALPGILHRARGERQSPWRRWVVAGGAAVATAGLVAAVLVIGPGTSDDRSGNPPVAGTGEPTAPATTEPTAEPSSQQPTEPTGGEAVTVEPGTVVPMALHYVSDYAGGTLVSGEFKVMSSGDVGVDAVRALLERKPREPFGNYWSGPGVPDVVSVTVDADGITVDFDGTIHFVCDPDPNDGLILDCIEPDGELALQQLVHTVQSAMRSSLPVQITVAGEPATHAFGERIDGPIAADPSVAPGIRVASPEQGATVGSPVAVTGESNVFEGSFVWEVIQDGTIVKHGIATGGSIEFAPFEFSVDLPPGDYTIAMWAENMAGDAEGLAMRLSPVYLDITVE